MVVTDPTMTSLQGVDDSSKYHCVPNVPIFIEHTRKGKDGEIAYKVTLDDLREAAGVINARAKSGVLGKMQFGHTLKDVFDDNGTLVKRIPETHQPPLAGLFKDARVGKFGPENKPAILTNFYYLKSELDEAKKYPFRSVEYYPDTKEITTVALLKRDPELDMGMLLFQRDLPCYFYSKELPMSDFAAQVIPDAPLTEEETNKFHAYMKKCFPDLHQQYMAGQASATAVVPQEYQRTPAVVPETTSRLAKENAELYAKNTEMNNRLASLETELKSDRQAVQYEKKLRELDPDGEVINVEAELKDLRTMTDAQATAHFERLTRTASYARTPVGQPLLRIGETVTREKPPTEYERNQAVNIVTAMQEQGKDYTFLEALRDVRAQK